MNQKMGIEGRKAMGWEEPKAGPPPYYYSQGYMHQHQPKKAKKHADAEC